MKRNGFSLLLVMVMVMSIFAGCGQKGNDTKTPPEATSATTVKEVPSTTTAAPAAAEKIKVGFAIKTQDGPYFGALVDTVKQLCKDAGWDITVLDANGDSTKEAENMDTFIAQGMDMIFLDSVDPSACIPSIDKAAEAGIGVINLDSGVNGGKYVTTVYSDNKQNGRLVGLAYAEKVGGEAIKAIVLSGGKGNIAGQERRDGLFCGIIEGITGMSEADAWKAAEEMENQLISTGKAFNEEANFTLAGQGWGGWSREEGLVASEDLITANNDLTCALGENDQMLFGTMTALQNAGIEGVDIVAAADGAKEAFDLIKQDKYFGSGLNSPGLVAQTGFAIAKEILVDGKDMWSYPQITLTKPAGVVKENVDEFYDLGF